MKTSTKLLLAGGAIAAFVFITNRNKNTPATPGSMPGYIPTLPVTNVLVQPGGEWGIFKNTSTIPVRITFTNGLCYVYNLQGQLVKTMLINENQPLEYNGVVYSGPIYNGDLI